MEGEGEVYRAVVICVESGVVEKSNFGYESLLWFAVRSPTAPMTGPVVVVISIDSVVCKALMLSVSRPLNSCRDTKEF